MQTKTKKKVSAVAIAAAAVLVLAGTMAYLADASGTISNIWDGNHVEVAITETGISQSGGADNGDKNYDLLPGTEASKDPTIHVDTDINAFVYAVVKDTVNSHGKTLVTYDIADGWVELDKATLTSKELDKYVNIFTDKKTGKLTVDPADSNTKIYYRVVNGTNQDHRFDYPVLKDNKVSCSSDLTNDDLKLLDNLSDAEKTLIFQTYAIQMQPFCEADATGDALIQGAKDAWNQTEPVVNVTGVTVTPETLEMEVGETSDPLTATVAPSNATNKTVTWSSSNDSVTTVDPSTGIVTAVAAGTATITATTADGNKTDTCEVTVTEPGLTFGYAVQLRSADSNEVVFWPAMGVNATASGVDHGGSHTGKCIHDSDVTWNYIKAHPTEFADCITNGCTRKVELDQTAFTSTECGEAIKTAGDGGGMVYDGLTSEEAMWEKTGDNTVARPSYNDTLDKIKAYSNLPASANMFLLSKDELESAEPNTADRIIYDNSGKIRMWWLAGRNEYDTNIAYLVNGGVIYYRHYANYGVCHVVGIAPGFSY